MLPVGRAQNSLAATVGAGASSDTARAANHGRAKVGTPGAASPVSSCAPCGHQDAQLAPSEQCFAAVAITSKYAVSENLVYSVDRFSFRRSIPTHLCGRWAAIPVQRAQQDSTTI
jgi:hypothetical protein